MATLIEREHKIAGERNKKRFMRRKGVFINVYCVMTSLSK